MWLIFVLFFRQRLFNAIDTLPCIKEKAQWALNWINPKKVQWCKPCVKLMDLRDGIMLFTIIRML